MTDGGKAALRLDPALIYSIGIFPLISKSNLYVKNGFSIAVLFSMVQWLRFFFPK